ncbi:MAG: acyl-CoA carboxylase subunit epsilon [Actinomycetales bacterium]|nr:acyl-CoA carboxylase subunit epsilon [Actinomycetales bacterium]
MTSDNSAAEQKPELQDLLKVVRGNPTAEELATVIAVLGAASAEAAAQSGGRERRLTSTWSRNASMLRSEIVPGPGQWRFSTRTR